MIAKSPIGHNQNFDVGRQGFGKPNQHLIFVAVPVVLEGVLVDAQPDQRCCAPVSRDEGQHDRRLVIGIKVGPVHGNNNFRARPDRTGDPPLRELVNVNSWVRQQPIYLLDGMFWQSSPRQREPLPDRVHRQRGAADDPKRCVR